MKNQKIVIGCVLVSAFYIAAQMMSDIASLRILFIAGMSIDGGTLIYPFTFTLRDMVHKVAGIKSARALIVAAAFINIFMAGLFWLVGVLPFDPSVGEQNAFSQALSPVWRIVLASVISEVISELIDTEAYQLWVNKVSKRYQWARVLVSNSVSIPVDSLLFSWIAFGGVFSASVVWAIFFSNVVVKGAMTLISLPGIYLVKSEEETF